MNRALLLLICDFLLLSMFALARFDQAPAAPATPAKPPEPEPDVLAERQGEEIDLVAMLQKTLESEQTARRALQDDLSRMKQELGTREEVLQEKQVELSRLQEKLQEEVEAADKLTEERLRLLEDKQRLAEEIQREKAALKEVQEASRREHGALQEELTQQRVEAAIIQERLRNAQGRLEEKQNQIEAARQRQEALEGEKSRLERERHQIASELQVARAEKDILAENLEHSRSTIREERQEKEALRRQTQTLSEGVQQLAQNSREIREEIQSAQPRSPNEVFQQFQAGRVDVVFRATFRGLFGRKELTYHLPTVLIVDGSGVYALLHADATPFDLQQPNGPLLEVSGEIRAGGAAIPLDRVGFLASDPRLLVIPLPTGEALPDPASPFPLAEDPFQFPEAVLINPRHNRYGLVNFQLEPDSPQYLRMDKDAFGPLTGDFTPSLGDLVFSQSGGCLGVMINNRMAHHVRSLAPIDVLSIGNQFDREAGGQSLDRLRRVAGRLPKEVSF